MDELNRLMENYAIPLAVIITAQNLSGEGNYKGMCDYIKGYIKESGLEKKI